MKNLNLLAESYTTEKEQWVVLPEMNYIVSSLGRVRNKCGKIVNTYQQSNGYLSISLYDHERKYKTTLGRVVAYAFGLTKSLNFDGKNEVIFIDNDKTNCKLNNLTIMPHTKAIEKRSIFGDRSKVTYVYDIDWKLLKTCKSIKEAAEFVNGAASNISIVINSEKRTAYGHRYKVGK